LIARKTSEVFIKWCGTNFFDDSRDQKNIYVFQRLSTLDPCIWVMNFLKSKKSSCNKSKARQNDFLLLINIILYFKSFLNNLNLDFVINKFFFIIYKLLFLARTLRTVLLPHFPVQAIRMVPMVKRSLLNWRIRV